MTILEKLKTIPKEEYNRIYAELNNWKIPKEFEGMFPENYPDCFNKGQIEELLMITSPPMHYIEEIIGEKEISKYHFLVTMGKTEEEWQRWWDNDSTKNPNSVVNKTGKYSFELKWNEIGFGTPLENSFDSFERLWLMFIMKENFNKTWNGKEWIDASLSV